MNSVYPDFGSQKLSHFYHLKNAPVHSVLLFASREEAISYPRGDIALGFCHQTGFISNLAFDPNLHEYSTGYEATQGFSDTFNTFHRNLALRLIERHNLYHKDIIEIGCGQGEFLSLLCELGNNRGVGFDPALVEARRHSDARDRLTFVKDFYSEKYADYDGDFICCKMTLEHIYHTTEFVSTVRRSIGNRSDTVVFFQVPNVRYVLREVAFWDIYYEHCSYFSPRSLARLFRKSGFDVMDLRTDYSDQYLMIEARPGTGRSRPLPLEESPAQLAGDIDHFTGKLRQKIAQWQETLHNLRQSGRRAVIWGGGSKGVSFLTTLQIEDQIEYAVDINPYKHGTFMAGTGQEIVPPEFLIDYRPDLVIVMNPVYCDEIQRNLDRLGVRADLIPL
jgi:SAM-dependent methyltransferase